MAKTIKIGLLRIASSELKEHQIRALVNQFPGDEFEFFTLGSKDFEEHAKLCKVLGLDFVILPRERPIPSLAMEKGFPHVDITPEGEIRELLPLNPDFKPFVLKKRD